MRSNDDDSSFTQQDCLFDWPYTVRLQVMSPTPPLRSAGQRLILFTDHQGGQVCAQKTILVTAPHLHLCLRKQMKDEAPGGFTLQEKILRHAHRTFQARRDLLRCTHTLGNRAETEGAYVRHISQVKEYELNIKKLEISSTFCEKKKQSKENMKP